jgi:exopolysaccharide production protein ExoY
MVHPLKAKSASGFAGGQPYTPSPSPSSSPIGGPQKRVFDIVAAIAAIFLLAPLMLVLALLVRLQDGGPALYRQQRIGLGGRPIWCLKFRSMARDAERRLQQLLEDDDEARAEWAQRHKLKNDPRITPLGRFLRQSSLDELPQLFNILNGEMSLVGPRPIVADEVWRYAEDFPAYCRGRPGLTGLWQISGRTDVSYRDRVSLDMRYAATQSFIGDLAIVVRTAPAVILRRGSY